MTNTAMMEIPVERARELREAERLLKLHQEVTYSVVSWFHAGACKATEPGILERVRQAVRAAIGADTATETDDANG